MKQKSRRKQKLKKLTKIHASLVDLAKYYWDNEDIKTAMETDSAVAKVSQAISIHKLVDQIKRSK